MYEYIEQNLLSVRERIADAARRVGRDPCEITLVAVTKGASDDEVRALLSLGVDAIAENRTALFLHRQQIAGEIGAHCACHLIGSLQTNKVKSIVGKTALIHSVDRPSLAAALEKEARKAGVTVDILIEVNSGREENKGGVLPEELFSLVERLSDCPHLSLRGLMTMAPDAGEETYRRCFRETRNTFVRLLADGKIKGDGILSMGMSDSYEIAVEEGATLVRVGSALFKKP